MMPMLIHQAFQHTTINCLTSDCVCSSHMQSEMLRGSGAEASERVECLSSQDCRSDGAEADLAGSSDASEMLLHSVCLLIAGSSMH